MSENNAPEFEVKECPRCHELLFADMDVCYGCLYDFSREKPPRHMLPVETAALPNAALPNVDVPADQVSGSTRVHIQADGLDCSLPLSAGSLTLSFALE